MTLETTDTYRENRRVAIRAGDTVKVPGLRGLFKVKEFRNTTYGWEAVLYGGPPNREMMRTVWANRLVRKRYPAAER